MKRKDYVLFAIKGLTFVLLLLLLDTGAGYFFRLLTDKAMEKNPQGMNAEYAMLQADADILIIGGSDAHSSFVPDIIEDSLSLSCYNCGIDGHGIFYQCSLINSILKRTTPKIIVWSTDPRFLTNRTKGIPETLYRFYNRDPYVKKMVIVYQPQNYKI